MSRYCCELVASASGLGADRWGSVVSSRWPWVMECVPVPEAVGEGLAAGRSPKGLSVLWCFPAWTYRCLSARFCVAADLATVATVLGEALGGSRERPDVVVLHRVPPFLPELLDELATELRVPIASSGQWRKAWQERLYAQLGECLAGVDAGPIDLPVLNGRLKQHVNDRLPV